MTLTNEAIEAARRRLDTALDTLDKELVDLGARPDGSVRVLLDEGFADAAQTTSERAQLLSLVDGLRQRLEDVRAALQRIERGTYGLCERCGNEIKPERLDAIPTASMCISCKQKL